MIFNCSQQGGTVTYKGSVPTLSSGVYEMTCFDVLTTLPKPVAGQANKQPFRYQKIAFF